MAELGEKPAGVVRVGACQTPEILGDQDTALDCIEQFAGHGADRGADLLLFPEGFLRGYLTAEELIGTIRRPMTSLGGCSSTLAGRH